MTDKVIQNDVKITKDGDNDSVIFLNSNSENSNYGGGVVFQNKGQNYGNVYGDETVTAVYSGFAGSGVAKIEIDHNTDTGNLQGNWNINGNPISPPTSAAPLSWENGGTNLSLSDPGATPGGYHAVIGANGWVNVMDYNQVQQEIQTSKGRSIGFSPTESSELDLNSYDTFVWNALTGNATATLPDDEANYKMIILKHATGGSPTTVTISCSTPGEQIFDNNATTLVLNNWDCVTLVWTGSKWLTVGKYTV